MKVLYLLIIIGTCLSSLFDISLGSNLLSLFDDWTSTPLNYFLIFAMASVTATIASLGSILKYSHMRSVSNTISLFWSVSTSCCAVVDSSLNIF